MNILIISEFFPTGKDLKFTGGVETRNLYIAKHISKKYKVTIITTRLRNTKEHEIIEGVNVLRVGKEQEYKATSSNIVGRISFIREAIKTGREQNPDIVEGTNFICHFIAKKIVEKTGSKLVAWYPDVWVGQWVENAGLVGILGEILERINLRSKYAAIIAISNETRLKLQKHTTEKIVVIPCGVEKSEFEKNHKKQNVVVCISRLAKYKNIKTLILAFALLVRSNKNFSLKIIGRGPEEKNLKTLVNKLHIDKNVQFVSNLKRKDLINNLASAHLFVLPSVVEGFGISVIEAA
ncbi:glycosyltransferase family 4 protein, partial [Candidatus Curtissbacteria bacterium]|nr:glycosyltransferase family 4 protein [Candidatus Curtissbacteria bacterium]